MKKRIENFNISIDAQIRELAELQHNATGHFQDNESFFVQFDDNYAVSSDGSIYQILPQRELPKDPSNQILFYSGETVWYNYAEDSAYDWDEESQEVIRHCYEQAELSQYGA